MKAMLAVALVFAADVLCGQCTWVPDQGTAGSPVLFSSCVSLTWDFGDSTQGSGTAAIHTYSAAGIYKWTARDESGLAANGTITIVELPGGQCSVCPIDVPTAGDTTKPVPFAICSDVASSTWSFGDGSVVTFPSRFEAPCWNPSLAPSMRCVNNSYRSPGVYTWTASVTSKDGQTCRRTGRITIIGCRVVSLTVDTHSRVSSGSVRLDWSTNGSQDCHPGGDVKNVSYVIDSDTQNVIDSVPDTVSSRTIELWRLGELGYHVLRVTPIVCRTCSVCGAACGPTWAGYDLAENEQDITVLGNANCPPVSITLQPVNQTVNTSPVTLTTESSASDAHYDWYYMVGPHDTLAVLGGFDENIGGGPTIHPSFPGFYWVVATSGCGYSARSNLVALCSAPLITLQPQNQSIIRGQGTVLTAKARGTEITLQWYAGTPQQRVTVPGASSATSSYYLGAAETTSSLSIPPLNANQSYFAEARDTCGNVIATALATITVQAPPRQRAVHQ